MTVTNHFSNPFLASLFFNSRRGILCSETIYSSPSDHQGATCSSLKLSEEVDPNCFFLSHQIQRPSGEPPTPFMHLSETKAASSLGQDVTTLVLVFPTPTVLQSSLGPPRRPPPETHYSLPLAMHVVQIPQSRNSRNRNPDTFPHKRCSHLPRIIYLDHVRIGQHHSPPPRHAVCHIRRMLKHPRRHRGRRACEGQESPPMSTHFVAGGSTTVYATETFNTSTTWSTPREDLKKQRGLIRASPQVEPHAS